ncbi:hypothetical protein ACFLYU_03695 [Candidatus Dependentiae bacterium]
MSKIISSIVVFLVFSNCVSCAVDNNVNKVAQKDIIVLNNPIMNLIDGKSFGINANIFGLILQSRREVRKRLYGISSAANGTKVGMYEFEGKKYCLIELAQVEKSLERAEHSEKARKEALKKVLHEAKDDLVSVIGSYIDSARGMKDPLLVMIEEFREKSGLGDFFLLDWGRTKDGDEIEAIRKNVRSLNDLKVLCLEMSGFLEAMARSCPKGKGLFVEMVRKAKQGK